MPDVRAGSTLTEVLRLLGPPRRRVPGAVGPGARSGERPGVHDQILVADRAVPEEALEDLAGPCGVAGLSGQARARDVRRHAVVGHRAPRVLGRGGLRKPHVARISGQLAALEGPDHRVAVADL